MLQVIVNEENLDPALGIPECIKNVKGYFRFHKKPEWFNDPLVLQIIKAIDHDEHVSGEVFLNYAGKAITADQIAGGTKALILLLMCDRINVFGTKCGDKCAEWMLQIAERKDVYVTFHHCMHFPRDFDALFVESERVTHNQEEFVDEFYRLITGEQ